MNRSNRQPFTDPPRLAEFQDLVVKYTAHARGLLGAATLALAGCSAGGETRGKPKDGSAGLPMAIAVTAATAVRKPMPIMLSIV